MSREIQNYLYHNLTHQNGFLIIFILTFDILIALFLFHWKNTFGHFNLDGLAPITDLLFSYPIA